MSYSIYKLVHLAAVIIFLGNIVAGLFWKAHADRSSNPRIIAHTLKGIIRSDRWFTIPAIFVILISGFGAAIKGGLPILHTGWIFWSIVLFSLSGIAFSARVAPLQKQLAELVGRGSDSESFDWALYGSLSKRWEWWGAFALLTPTVAAILMVLKPVLPGL